MTRSDPYPSHVIFICPKSFLVFPNILFTRSELIVNDSSMIPSTSPGIVLRFTQASLPSLHFGSLRGHDPYFCQVY